MTHPRAEFFLIICRECEPQDDPLVMPFPTPEARGRWAADHKAATGHDRWLVLDPGDEIGEEEK